jgi:hypothetical protein
VTVTRLHWQRVVLPKAAEIVPVLRHWRHVAAVVLPVDLRRQHPQHHPGVQRSVRRNRTGTARRWLPRPDRHDQKHRKTVLLRRCGGLPRAAGSAQLHPGPHRTTGVADLYIEKGETVHLLWAPCFTASQLLVLLDQANLGDYARRRLRDMYLRDGS